MHATREATERFVDEADLAEVGYTTLGRSGLKVSRLGFGTFRVDDRADVHKDALAHAVEQGVNLIDTAGAYVEGRAQTAVGQVLAELKKKGSVSREQVVVVDKIGLVQGETLARVREEEAAGTSIPGMVHFQEGLWYCIHPEWIEKELSRSLERLQLDAVDLLLIHNPETFLAEGAQLRKGTGIDTVRKQLRDRLEAAFTKLEELVKAGKIGWYGVSSQTFVAPSGEPTSIGLKDLVDIAKKVGGQNHHFVAIELPMNLLESRAAGGNKPLLVEAKAAGLAVLIDRPLTAVLGPNQVLRLAEPPQPPQAARPLADVAAEVQAIEAIFAQDFAPKIKVEGGPPASEMFRWGHELADAPAKLSGLDHWMAMQSQVIAPQVQGLLNQLSQGFGKDVTFQAWGKRYVEALNTLLAAVSAELIQKLGAQAAGFRSRIEPHVPERWREASLSRQALATLLSTDGITSVLVGMRRKGYVDDALGAVGLPALDQKAVRNVYEAFAK